MAEERVHPLGFGELVSLADYSELADENASSFGRTDLYSTGFKDVDEWMGGGFGKTGSYENFTIFGDSGVGKSTVALQFLKQSVIDGVPQAWIILEDAPQDVNARFRRMFASPEEANKAITQMVKLKSGNQVANPMLMSETFMESDFKLADIYDWIKFRIETLGIKLFLFDHIQYAFDAAEESASSQANQIQRKFMKQIADLIKRNNATIVMVSHTKKDRFAQGMDRMYGSSAIAQTITKNMEVKKVENYPGVIELKMHKNRHAADAIGSCYLWRQSSEIGAGASFGFSKASRYLDED